MIGRYLVDINPSKIPQEETDFLVIGSGNAGLRAAIEVAKHGKVLLISKAQVREGSTVRAQGGIAVAMSPEDDVSYHVSDTLKAGAGLCDETAVRTMVEDGIERVKELISWGAKFDRQESGELAFGMEAAHGVRRVVHARGDATGEETEDVLVSTALKSRNVHLMEYHFVVDLFTDLDTCYGAIALDKDQNLLLISAKAVILASGGLGQIYKYTSNPEVATGDGYAIAYRAGCELTDMEFVQFHPTILYLQGAPRFLITEAVRGEGGILSNGRGERFMERYDERLELAPRDVVSRAIVMEMERTERNCVYLDVTDLDPSFIKSRFPNIYKTCQLYGIDITTDLIPVQAAAHFMMGGVKTDLKAQTNIKGLFACGEIACTGVHGANRLASNSLSEGLVFGSRAGAAAVEYAKAKVGARHTIPPHKDIDIDIPPKRTGGDASGAPEVSISDIEEVRSQLRELMWQKAGIIRDGENLKNALITVNKWEASCFPNNRGSFELQNMIQTSKLIIQASLKREESRGAHYRKDFPYPDDLNWKRRITFKVLYLASNGKVRLELKFL